MITRKTLETREDWLKARSRSIGGSDAAAIVGASPYKTNIELWEEKTGRRSSPDISESPFVKYGTEAEEHLRALFALDFPGYKVSYEPNNIWLNTEYPFALDRGRSRPLRRFRDQNNDDPELRAKNELAGQNPHELLLTASPLFPRRRR